MNDFNYNPNPGRGQDRQTDLVLAVNEFAYVLNTSTGVIQVHVGPRVVTISQQEDLVIFDEKSKKFVRTNDFNRAKQLFTSAPEGWYVILKNPAKENEHPEAARANTVADKLLEFGVKINIPGPTSFALFPGQMSRVIRGHKLRTNQYLIARVYNAAAANKNGAEATMLDAEGNVLAKHETYFTGQQLVIKGTEVSFYIPPTGIEVIPTESGEYVREAVTLERLEYVILKDESGTKTYERGPAVVFPKPTETFVQTPQKGIIFRALELSPISGIYLKVIAEYTEKDKDNKTVTHPVGEELFITGNDQMIYYPRPEHALIQYDGKYMHHAIAIPRGEGRYILNRLNGDVKTIIGPAMYLPDPRFEVVVKRILTAKECETFYPGNKDVLNYNLGLSEAQAEKMSKQGKTNKTDVINNAYTTSNQENALAIFAATANIARGSSYTKPRTIVLDTKYEGVVTISPWTGYAVNVVSKSGKRETIIGPATRMLDYDETLEIVNLSTGKPKSSDRLLSTAYLRIENNQVGDIIVVQTKDYVDVALKVSYNVNFVKEHKDKWFCVDNYVKFLCDKMRADLKDAAKRYGIEEFYANTTKIVKDTVLGANGEGRFFEANGMQVSDVELLEVEVEAAVAKMLNKHQNEMVSKMLELSDAAKKAEMVEKLAEYERREADLAHEAKMYSIELAQKVKAQELENKSAIAAQERAETEASNKAKADMQPILDAIMKAQLARDRAADDEKIKTEKELAAIEEAKQKAYADTVAKMFAAISPDLIAALESQANANIMSGLGQSLSPAALANGESVADTMNTLLRGTSMEKTLKNIVGAINNK